MLRLRVAHAGLRLQPDLALHPRQGVRRPHGGRGQGAGRGRRPRDTGHHPRRRSPLFEQGAGSRRAHLPDVPGAQGRGREDGRRSDADALGARSDRHGASGDRARPARAPGCGVGRAGVRDDRSGCDGARHAPAAVRDHVLRARALGAASCSRRSPSCSSSGEVDHALRCSSRRACSPAWRSRPSIRPRSSGSCWGSTPSQRARSLLRGVAFGVGVLAGVVPLALYNWWAFGSIFHLSYQSSSYQSAGGDEVAQGLEHIPAPGFDVAVLLESLFGRSGLLTLSPVLVCGAVGAVLLYRRGLSRRDARDRRRSGAVPVLQLELRHELRRASRRASAT